MNEVANAMIHSGATVVTVAASSAAQDEWFVINLCASMTPMPSVPKSLKGFEEFKLYQVSRVEDGRRRYRLRLGFFNCEAEAELLLGSIRTLYPAAFASAASQEDLRFQDESRIKTQPANNATAGSAAKESAPIKNEAAHAPATVIKAVPAPASPKSGGEPVRQISSTAATSKPVSKPIDPPEAAATPAPQAKTSSNDDATRIMPTPVRVSSDGKATALKVDAKSLDTSEMSLEFQPTPEPGVPANAVSAAAQVKTLESTPFHVGRGVDVPDVQLDFAPEADRKAPQAASSPSVVQKPMTAASQAPAAAKPASANKPLSNSTPTLAHPVVSAPTAPAAKPYAPPVVDDYVPILDTTLTIRTLTQTEKDDPNQPKWFAVELTASEHPFNLEAMPRLDIFAAYRLYSVVVSENGKVRHALRLGFFKEEVSADAVSGYLKTFFPTPTITRIGVAEYNRFAEPKPKAAEPAADDNVVKLSDKRDATPINGALAQKTPASSKGPAATNHVNRTQAVANKSTKKPLASDSGIRSVARPQSFFARLIGRDLD